jgi:hypothetical protein
MNPRIGEIWVYLAASPLLGLTLTLLAYQGAVMVSKRYDNHPLANPVLLAVTALVTLLWITGTPYRLYFDGAQFVHFLLGPATVALAIPLHAQFARLKRMALPAACRPARRIAHRLDIRRRHRQPAGCQRRHAAFAGAEIGNDADCHGHRREHRRPSIAHRGARDPDRHHRCGLREQPLFSFWNQDRAVQGFAVGIASHGIGTARAFQVPANRPAPSPPLPWD